MLHQAKNNYYICKRSIGTSKNIIHEKSFEIGYPTHQLEWLFYFRKIQQNVKKLFQL